jgi:hypothetical protein
VLIHLELHVEAFDPEQINAISLAFEDVLIELRIRDRNQPIVPVVAKRIMDFARKGELRRERLRQIVVESIRGEVGARSGSHFSSGRKSGFFRGHEGGFSLLED